MRAAFLSAALVGLLAAGGASAGQLKPLSDAELDGVSAGATAIALGGTVTFGDILSETVSVSSAVAAAGAFATATNTTLGVAVSTLFPASSTSVSASAASLP